MTAEQFRIALRNARVAKKMKQSDVGKKFNMNASQICNIENGKTASMRIDFIFELIDFIGYDVAPKNQTACNQKCEAQ